MSAGSLAVTTAFERSAPWVERLAQRTGPFDPPQDPTLREAVQTLWDRRGKRLRSHLVYWCAELANVAPEDVELYAWAAEAVHTATLLHDDVIDQAEMRRGGASINQIYDNTVPIISGDYLISDVVEQLAARGDPRLLRSLCSTLKDLCTGEVIQYRLRFQIPESAHLLEEVIQKKTTSLFLWCASVGPLLQGNGLMAPVTSYMTEFGRLFQMSDDLLDILGSGTKDRWNDLREGRLNSFVWRIVQKTPSLRELVRESFHQKRVSEDLIRAFESSREVSTSIPGFRAELREMAARAGELLKNTPNSPIQKALSELPRLLVDRCS